MLHKNFDRFPNICAAGKVKNPSCLTTELKNFTIDEVAENIITKNNLKAKLQDKLDSGVIPRIPPKLNSETVQSLIEANSKKFRFKEFEENFYENLYYHSVKTGKIGESAKIGSKPDHVTNTSRTFGKLTKNNGSLYDTICPRITSKEILKEQQIFHDKYVLSHNSFFPSEQMRRYPKESFDIRNKTFGRFDNIDISGKAVKDALTDCNSGKSFIITKTQDDHIQKNNHKLGKAIKRQNLDSSEDVRFKTGNKKDKHTPNCLIHNLSLCYEHKELLEAISYVSCLRVKLKNKTDFNLTSVENALHKFDTNNSCHLDWPVLFQVLASYFVHVDQNKIKLIANHYKIINDENQVNYIKFLKLFDRGIPLPKLGKFLDLPKIKDHFWTTYRQFANDVIHKSKEHNLPAEILDKGNVTIPSKRKIDLKNLCDKSNVKSCITPSISAQFGLVTKDYLKLRNKEEIRQIFRNLLNNINDEIFDQLYKEALNLHESSDDKVSVESFKCCLVKLVKYRKNNIEQNSLVKKF